jgi:acyl-CoA synthetase (NDP forming)
VQGGFTGSVTAVNAQVADDERIEGVPAYRHLSDVPGEVDLVIVAVPADEVLEVVGDAAAAGAVGLIVMSGGFAEADEAGREMQAELVALARGHGMRVVGPNALGLLNTSAEVKLNASLAPRLPATGRVGFFSQSGALGATLLERAEQRGLGLSTFVSAGNRADVSGNDLMQYWEDDAATDVVLLYLESIGNPRKFTRIARRLSRRKPVVAVRSGRSTQALPLGHRVRRTTLPPAAVDALFEQSGVIQTATLREMFDVAVLLTHIPLPEGATVAIVGNSDALAVLAADAVESEGLVVAGSPVVMRGDATPQAFAAAMAAAVDDPAVHAVLALHVPPVAFSHTEHAQVIVDAARRGTTPVLAVLVATDAERGLLTEGATSVPTFGTVEEAVKALAAVVRYADWRRTPERPPPDLSSLRVHEADELLGRLVSQLPVAPQGAEARLRACGPDDELSRLLAAYDIAVRPSVVVTTAAEAVKAARALGYPVALSATDPESERRVDGVGVRLDLYNDRAVRGAWRAVTAELEPGRPVERTVQQMAARGVDARIGTVEDPSFGPVVAMSVGGAVPQLLGDRCYGIPPLGVEDAHAMVASRRVAPLLSRVPTPAVEALEALLIRVGRLAEESPALAWLVLDPVLLTPDGPVVLSALGRVRRPGTRTDSDARRLSR